MFKKTLSPKTFQLLKKICRNHKFNNFYLVGGTALALQLGHRKSGDLDFFSRTEFEASLTKELEKYGKTNVIVATTNTIEVKINSTRLFFMFFGYPLYKKIQKKEEIRIANPIDIGLMKLMCLTSRQTKKDIIDLYFIDREVILLEDLLEILDKHIPEESFNKYSAAKELLNPDKFGEQPMPVMLKEVKWEEAYELVSAKITNYLLGAAVET